MARLQLPTKEEDLVEALDRELCPAEQEANVHYTTHRIIDAYLAGVRRFRILDRWSGQLSIAFENARGELQMRYEAITRLYLNEVGRYMKINIHPTSTRKRVGLDSVRKAAIAHATLGAVTAPIPLDQLKREAIIPYLKYGTVGLCHVETGNDQVPDMGEIVPPRELRGIPAWVDGCSNLLGIGRKRWVPLLWLKARMKDLFDKQLKFTNPEEELRAQEVPWGTVPPEQDSHEGHYGGSAVGITSHRREDQIGSSFNDRLMGSGENKASVRKDGRLYVPVEEVYIYDNTQQFLSRYIIKVGKKILLDEDFEKIDVMVVPPLHVARHTDIGKMFARGFIAPLMPMNDQVEQLLKSLFKNIQELDMFGTLFVPGGSGIDIKRWRTGPRPRVEKFEADPLNPDIRPFPIQPANTGTMPAKVAEFASQQMDLLAGQGPSFRGEATGRVDSAAGLGFLANTSNMALGLPTNGLADAFAGFYRRLLQVTKERLQPGSSIQLAAIDDAVAGVVINDQTGEMELMSNPIPNPWEVHVDVKDRTPRDENVRKQELKELYGMQLVDPIRFWTTAMEEDLDMPGAPKELWETWRKVTWQIVTLFRDGQTPGHVDVGEHTQNPDIQLIKLQEFMNKIEYSLASEQVKEAFETWKVDLEILAQQHYPAGLPPPEAVADQQMAIQRQMDRANQGGAPPIT